MKFSNKKWIALVVVLCFAQLHIHAQLWETNGNNLGAPGILGSNNNFDVLFRTNGNDRMKILNETGFLNINNQPVDPSGNMAIGSLIPPAFVPISRLHVLSSSSSVSNNGYREWMQWGASFSVDHLEMYLGPGKVGAGALQPVIAWTPGAALPGVPGVLRFVATDGDGSGNGKFSQDGLEVARMTDEGRMGVGTGFSNTLQPIRTLHTYHPSMPQFRISSSLNPDPLLGVHADFQVSTEGNLHLRPRNEDNHRTVAIGFLPGELSTPLNTGAVQTTLDVGGVTRVRNVPDAESNCLITGLNIGSNANDHFLTRLDFLEGEDADCHVLGADGTWVDICALSGEDFDWQYNNLDVWMGTPSNEYPTRNAGIGTDQPNAKLHVVNFEPNPLNTNNSTSLRVENASSGLLGAAGLYVEMSSNNNRNYGVWSEIIGLNYANTQCAGRFLVRSPGQFLFGVDALVAEAQGTSAVEIAAVRGQSNGGATNSTVANNYGVYGEVTGCTGDFNAAIYGVGNINGAVNSCWAGYFDGPVYSSITQFPSDAALKTNITEVESVHDLLSGLQVKSYEFVEHEAINLPTGLHYGFIAQEVEAVLPELVSQLNTPTKFDTLGNIITEPIEFKSVNYTEMIPLLVGALNEQKAVIDAQQDQLSQQAAEINSLQSELASGLGALESALYDALENVQEAQRNMEQCCQQKDGTIGTVGTITKQEIILNQNIPNPFSNHTRIEFTLPEASQVVLEISDSQGRKLDKLLDGYLNGGMHSVTWDGSPYSPGIYYYSLYADGQLLTKKMIKH